MSTSDDDAIVARWRALTEPLRSQPHRSAVLADFDGTLAPIVADPAAAGPAPGALEALTALAARYGLVGIVTGRPVAYLDHQVPPEVVVAGQYGLEVRRDGQVVVDPAGRAWMPIVEQVAHDGQRTGPVGVEVEHKPMSVTVHFRGRPDLQGEVERWATAIGRSTGLEVRPARMAVELHPPVPVDKGTTVKQLVGDHVAVVYLGDDVGDLPAFDALDELDRRGVAVVRVAVRSTEGPAELVERADLVVEDQWAAAVLLADLAEPG